MSLDGTPVFEILKARGRSARSWLLSVGLAGEGQFLPSEVEVEASRRFSVVVPVHDAPSVTRRCLESLERFQGNAEVVVVDDGSRLPATRRLLDTFCARRAWQLIRHAAPQGHSRASEAGVSASQREYVCLLNSDALVTQHSWLAIEKAFALESRIAVVGPSTSQTPTAQQVWRAEYCRRYWSDNQIFSFSAKYVSRHRNDPIVDLPMVGGFAFFIRRHLWAQLNGFDDNLPDYGNETELCRRVLRAGFRVVWARGSYIHHLGSESYGRTIGLDKIKDLSSKADLYIGEKSF